LEHAMCRSMADARVAVLGLTFKAGTDDLRESPAMRIAARLVERGATVSVHDPLATVAGAAALARSGIAVAGCATAEAACDGADAVVVATEWPEYRSLDWARISHQMRGRTIFDARAIVNRVSASDAGFRLLIHGAIARSEPPSAATTNHADQEGAPADSERPASIGSHQMISPGR
jgi:UDPglucose 6-dehydrogenase